MIQMMLIRHIMIRLTIEYMCNIRVGRSHSAQLIGSACSRVNSMAIVNAAIRSRARIAMCNREITRVRMCNASNIDGRSLSC